MNETIKRKVVRKGDLYFVPLGKGKGVILHYLCKDTSDLNGHVVRVYEGEFCHGEVEHLSNSQLVHISNRKILFYATTTVNQGINLYNWNKIGNVPVDPSQYSETVYFGHCRVADFEISMGRDTGGNKPWLIWKINQPPIEVHKVPDLILPKLEIGGVKPASMVMDRIRLGYYTWTMPEYDFIHREAWPDVNTYTKKIFGHKNIFFHFLGNNLIQYFEVCVKSTSEEQAGKTGYIVNPEMKLGDINWLKPDFISKEEYDGVI